MQAISCPVTVLTKQTNTFRPIYLDNQSTTPADPRVVEAMLPYFTHEFGNPHSDAHVYAWETNATLEKSRNIIANLINADQREIVFTSGATESCNLAIRGLANKRTNTRNKIVTVATEHPCVLETCKSLQERQHKLSILPVQNDGIIDLELLEKVIDEQTLLLSVMLANNEIGVIQPLEKIAAICHKFGVFVHTDATQAVGKMPVNIRKLDVDFMSFSPHKYYGPKGIGALYMRYEHASNVQPLFSGGGQEGGFRPGTVALALVAGFAKASSIALKELDKDMEHIEKLTDMLYITLKNNLPELRLHGHKKKRLVGNLNIAFPDISGSEIIERVSDQIAISTGSACSSEAAKPSHVLEALGLKAEEAEAGIRMSVGRFNTEEEIQKAAEVLIDAVLERR